MPLTKVLITVKTYPSISSKYDELVCTAGFLEDGTWIRVFPVQFRKKAYHEQYTKYEWIELDLTKNKSDFRPESYRPVSHDTPIKILDKLDTKYNWAKRKEIVLKSKVYTNLKELISEAHDKKIMTSLAIFKPKVIKNFIVKPASREWDKSKIAKLEAERAQYNLFQQPEKPFEVVKKLPYKFSYEFEDDEGTQSTLMIEDWEIGSLFWNCFEKYGDEEKAIADVKKKYFDDFAMTKDLHLYLGTSQVHHFVSINPFMIIGTFHPKKEEQLSLF